jgi:hypothetical protein
MALAGTEAERILCGPPASAGNLEIVPAALGDAAAGLALAHEFAFTEVVPSRQGHAGCAGLPLCRDAKTRACGCPPVNETAFEFRQVCRRTARSHVDRDRMLKKHVENLEQIDRPRNRRHCTQRNATCLRLTKRTGLVP